MFLCLRHLGPSDVTMPVPRRDRKGRYAKSMSLWYLVICDGMGERMGGCTRTQMYAGVCTTFVELFVGHENTSTKSNGRRLMVSSSRHSVAHAPRESNQERVCGRSCLWIGSAAGQASAKTTRRTSFDKCMAEKIVQK